MKNSNYLLLFITVILFTLFLGIGYAQITGVTLVVDGNASLDKQSGVIISNVQYISDQNANLSNCNINTYYQSDLDTSISLSTTDSTSYITYQISILNSTDSTIYYDDIIYDQSFYSNENIIIETDLVSGQSVNSGQSITFNATFKYSDDYIASASAPYNNTLDSFVNFHFVNTPPGVSYNITYVGFDNNNYPTTISSGDTLNITFDAPAPSQIHVIGSSNYTYSNNTLTIVNVTNDITITNVSSIPYPVDDNNGQQIDIHTPGIDSSNTIRVTDLLNLSFEGLNISGRSINQIDVDILYTTSNGSAQSINVILNIGEQEYSQVMNFRGKQTNSHATVSFTGIMINNNDFFTISSTRNNITNGNVVISDELVSFHYAN